MTEQTQPQDIEQLVIDTVSRFEKALSSAVEEYGSEAVDLALFAYQVDSIRHLSIPLLTILVYLVYLFKWGIPWLKWSIKKENDTNSIADDSGDYYMWFVLVNVLVLIPVISSVVNIFNPVRWFAAFGYPEVFIVTKALQSVGLL